MKWIYNLKMRSKLIIAFVFISLFSGAMGTISLHNMKEATDNSVRIYEKNEMVIKDLTLVKSNLIQINLDINKILQESNSNNIKALISEIDELKSKDDELLADYEKHIVDPGDRGLFEKLKNILTQYRNNREELLKYINKGDYESASIVYKDLDVVSNDIVKATDNYITYNLNQAEEADKQNSELYRTTVVYTLAIGVIGFIISVIAGFLIAFRISGKIKKILDFAISLSDGNLEHKIVMDSRDEIGELAIALNKAADKRKEYEENLVSSYEELEASYEEVQALEQELREKYNDLESSYEEITALEEELREKYTEISINEEMLRSNEEWYKLITEASYDALWDYNVKEEKMHFSDRWYMILGYDKENSYGDDWTKLIHEDDYIRIMDTIRQHWQNKESIFTVEYRIKNVDGIYTWMQSIGKILFDEDGKPTRLAGSHKNINDIKEYQHKLEYIAYHDYLTDLPNRQYMHKMAEDWFGRFGSKAAIIFIDIDDFKYINDTLGHNYGDFLICAIADRLHRLNNIEESLIRLGGDEFVIVLRDVQEREEVEGFVKKILNSFKKSFNLNNNYLQVTSSIGVSIFPDDGKDIDDLLTKADIAMYKSKNIGKNNYTFFHPGMNDKVVERMEIERYLRNALDKNEFILYYQPQVDASTGRISSFEALIRWISPELGFVPPDKFIKLAEENHRIIEIGNWVLREACEFIKNVHIKGYEECYISINVSIIQLMQSDFVDNVVKIIKEVDVNPNYIEIEITESIFIESYDNICDKLDKLRSIGIKIALDDFGKGYSSLSYLKQLPISTLKIDKTFIDDVVEDNKVSLVENIIDIGHKMNLNVVAEGVETEEQLNYLNIHRCDKIQGYYFSRPVPDSEAIKLLRA